MKTFFHNTLSGEIELFEPIKTGEVSMYHCGPTVYSKAHIGNMRAYIFADILKRFFLYQGYKVNQVINITDVGHLTDDGDGGDDKVEKKAREAKLRAQDIINEVTKYFFDDLKLLNINTENTLFPKATDHIKEQIEMIQILEKKGHTYQTSDGIYFDTSTYPPYGKLGNINLENLKEGARVEINEEKKNPTDFALWKFSKLEDKRQQEWESPWGIGFPGWHIECSAMSKKYLGETFDIHTGGIDHIPVHHNNEIAQSESANGKEQANFWLHFKHILINNEKISKSLGNDIYIDDLLKKNISPLAYRYWLLTADYKTQINFTWEALIASKTAYEKLVIQISNFEKGGEINSTYKDKFLKSLNDDLNTPQAIATIWELLKNSSVSEKDKKATILDFDKVLGLNLEAISNLASKIQINVPDTVQQLINEREQSRKIGDFIKADALREMIIDEGYDIKDTPEGPKISLV
ncbi:MAG: cysteine--tRNA ligase [Candidatus Pacebacteria bacterium]|nr:cysteine--tRNA ligase [Candidatus Paceibacterota bacterium]